MHDKDSESRDRVAWTHTVNMLTRDPDLAWKVMAYTAKSQDRLKEASGQVSTGRKCEKPVMAYSLSWHPEQDPDKDHMLETALDSLKVLGLSEHECMIVAHRDTPHRHVHVIVNRIHPITGLVASNSHSYRKLSSFALEYAREHGLEYSPQREENAKKREKGQESNYRDNRIQEAWDKSDNGRSLIAALEASGLTLAHGNKRLVVVDPKGKTINPVRHIEGIRSKNFRERLSDIDLSALPTVDEAIDRKRIKPKKKVASRSQREDQIKKIRQKYRLHEQETAISELRAEIQNAPWWKKLIGLTRNKRESLRELQDDFLKSKSDAEREMADLKKLNGQDRSHRENFPTTPITRRNHKSKRSHSYDSDKMKDSSPPILER
ncbi:MAG: relaxase/mobilization nuclease domain-containing protein [Puniceicoccaceae bacterium]